MMQEVIAHTGGKRTFMRKNTPNIHESVRLIASAIITLNTSCRWFGPQSHKANTNNGTIIIRSLAINVAISIAHHGDAGVALSNANSE
jgi:hypothetical protein